jgi:hypothetical protein
MITKHTIKVAALHLHDALNHVTLMDNLRHSVIEFIIDETTFYIIDGELTPEAMTQTDEGIHYYELDYNRYFDQLDAIVKSEIRKRESEMFLEQFEGDY